jgi:hypothetical protein
MSTKNMNLTSPTSSLDNLVYDYFRFAIDAILTDRKAKLNPITASSQLVSNSNSSPAPSVTASPSTSHPSHPSSSYHTNVDQINYIAGILQTWRKSLSFNNSNNNNKPIALDIYLYHTSLQTHILIERWSIQYQASSDFASSSSSTSSRKSIGGGYGNDMVNAGNLSSSRLYGTINRRIQTLLRSLYCFVRILPGFNLLHLSQIEPLMHFQLYDGRMNPSDFFYDASKHAFPVISTSKGRIATVVTFVNSLHVKVRLLLFLLSFVIALLGI